MTVYVVQDESSHYLDAAVIIAANEEEALTFARADGMRQPKITNHRSEPGLVERFIE